MATIIRTDGTIIEVSPANGKVFTLAELQAVVGGYLEALHLPDGRVLYLNEEGKLDRPQPLPVNERATYLVRGQLAAGDYIAGDVILCTLAETGDDPSQGDEEEEAEEAESGEEA